MEQILAWLNRMTEKVLVCCKDLFSTARIGETGKLVGTPVEFVRAPAELPARLGDPGPALVIVDLTAQGWDYDGLFARQGNHGRSYRYQGSSDAARLGGARRSKPEYDPRAPFEVSHERGRKHADLAPE